MDYYSPDVLLEALFGSTLRIVTHYEQMVQAIAAEGRAFASFAKIREDIPQDVRDAATKLANEHLTMLRRMADAMNHDMHAGREPLEAVLRTWRETRERVKASGKSDAEAAQEAADAFLAALGARVGGNNDAEADGA